MTLRLKYRGVTQAQGLGSVPQLAHVSMIPLYFECHAARPLLQFHVSPSSCGLGRIPCAPNSVSLSHLLNPASAHWPVSFSLTGDASTHCTKDSLYITEIPAGTILPALGFFVFVQFPQSLTGVKQAQTLRTTLPPQDNGWASGALCCEHYTHTPLASKHFRYGQHHTHATGRTLRYRALQQLV